MHPLNLPTYSFKIKDESNTRYIFDAFRLKWLKLTPEEWVRQHFAYYLMMEKNYPKGRLALEYGLKINGLSRRCDIVFFDNALQPKLIVECKAPKVPINQKVFDQIARYNFQLKVDFLIVTNGLQHFACRIDYEKQTYYYLKEIPEFNELKG